MNNTEFAKRFIKILELYENVFAYDIDEFIEILEGCELENVKEIYKNIRLEKNEDDQLIMTDELHDLWLTLTNWFTIEIPLSWIEKEYKNIEFLELLGEIRYYYYGNGGCIRLEKKIYNDTNSYEFEYQQSIAYQNRNNERMSIEGRK